MFLYGAMDGEQHCTPTRELLSDDQDTTLSGGKPVVASIGK